jgi:transcriptional regulator with XRE-family HTH domain
MRNNTLDRLQKGAPSDVAIFVHLSADLVVRIHQILKEKGITKKELANRLDKSPSEISKWLGGDHNFTLQSIATFSAEPIEQLLEVTKRDERAGIISDGTYVPYICS